MTKEELAKKKGLKSVKQTPQSPSEAIVAPLKNKPEKTRSERNTPVKTVPAAKNAVKKDEPKAEPEKIAVKKSPGKPKKRKDGDKKTSFWLDEDLVKGLYAGLTYGDSAGDLINEAIREYQKAHKTYQP